jgi:aspartyl-tRNA(Asn)/glutamyl-tRNA(Gln) amidotransferase subunit A
MTDLTSGPAAELGRLLSAGEVSAREVTQAHLDRITAVDDRVQAFLYVDTDGALAAADDIDARRARGEQLGPLAGVPLALKDVLTQRGVPTTAGSKILDGWRPPYDATVVTRLRAAGVVILGKTNMDEFAMGSSTENSAYHPTRNPWDLDRIPGGSSGGSSAAVASFQAPLGIGTDTGGSIRQPAAVCGLVGVKPTYGGVSRYGLIAFSSSLDQAGPLARTVEDAALLHEAIAGYDPLDSTSIDAPVPPVIEAARNPEVTGLRVGVVRELTGAGYQPGVEQRFREAVELLATLGAEIVEVSCPHFGYALPAYYLIAPSEASSNLARFDAMRYGLRVGDDGVAGAEAVMAATRAAGFGAEVKRRIILGTYALSSGYYEAYYGQAQKVRTLISRDFAAAYDQVDVLVSPTTPTTAFPIGERTDDPLAMYLADLATIPANLAGGAAMSLPCGRSPADGLPVGLQIMAPPLADDRLYRVGAAVEAAYVAQWGGPLLNGAPAL